MKKERLQKTACFLFERVFREIIRKRGGVPEITDAHRSAFAKIAAWLVSPFQGRVLSSVFVLAPGSGSGSSTLALAIANIFRHSHSCFYVAQAAATSEKDAPSIEELRALWDALHAEAGLLSAIGREASIYSPGQMASTFQRGGCDALLWETGSPGRAPLLVIDSLDAGAARVASFSGWVEGRYISEHLVPVPEAVEERLSHHRPAVIISRLSLPELADAFGDDRLPGIIWEMCASGKNFINWPSTNFRPWR